MHLKYSGRFSALHILCASASCVAIGLALSNAYSRSHSTVELEKMGQTVALLMKENNKQKQQIADFQASNQSHRAQQTVLSNKETETFTPPIRGRHHVDLGLPQLITKKMNVSTKTYVDRGSFAGALFSPIGRVAANSAYSEASFTPRGYIDTHLRMGSERSLGSTDVFYPFAWNGKYLGFADIRLTAATDSSIEGNAGIGIRRFNEARTGLLGLYGYLDQRRTEYGNNFTQLTVGTEWLAENWEIRTNAYLPLSGKRSTTAAAPTTFSLSGTSLVATGGSYILTEVPNHGIDTEFGARLPLPEYNYLRNIWGYAGAYHFDSDETESINGYRLRASADITDKFSLGAEWRQDNVRDNEFLVEVRLRIPFDEDEDKEQHSLPMYERLIQQPVRDVDIVVQGTQTTETTTSGVINTANGTQQRILTVDNSAAGGGN